MQNIETYIDHLYNQDYKEMPPTLESLLCSEKFFGTLTGYGKMVYPIWKERLEEVLVEDTKYLVVFTGAIGTGKSRSAIWGIAYVLARLLCLRDPWRFFNLSAGGKMSVVFFNLTKSLGESRGFRLLQDHLLASSWFRERGFVKGKGLDQHVEFSLFEYKIGSPYAQGFGSLGHDVVLAVMDEVDSPTESEKQKIRVLRAYEQTVRRFETRFVDDITKETIGKFFLVASKQEQLSFLNTFIAKRRNSPSVFVVDIPYWATRAQTLSGRTFSVAIGDVYIPSFIITSSEELSSAKASGLQIIEVPIEYLESFERDLAGALKDIAGISVSTIRRSKLFPSEKVLLDCYDPTKPNPVAKTTIEIGLKDDIDLMKFVDLSKLRMPKSTPRYIHEDISYSGDGDALGLGMSGICHWTKSNVMLPDGRFEVRRVPVVETDFAFRLKAPPGDRIPLFRVRKFILDLQTVGINIKMFTADLSLLSEDTKQLLERRGVTCDYLSLDRDITPYLEFANIVAEGRWICSKSELLHFELKNLEHDREKRKIDHPNEISDIVYLPDGSLQEVVMVGSKDLADGVTGSVYSALKDSGVLPVDKEVMRDILKVVSARPAGELQGLWWLGRDKAYSSAVEQYVLKDKSGQFWHWLRETSDSIPRLNGPYEHKPAEADVVIVDDPRSFMPGQQKEQGKASDERTTKFLSLLKGVRERS